MVNDKSKQRITISLVKEVFERISSIASENDVSIAWVIRYAVDKFLKEWREGRQEQLFLPLGKNRGKK
jgi:predicted transcriptional regulator